MSGIEYALDDSLHILASVRYWMLMPDDDIYWPRQMAYEGYKSIRTADRSYV